MNDLKVYGRNTINCKYIGPLILQETIKASMVEEEGIEKVMGRLLEWQDVTLILDNEQLDDIGHYNVDFDTSIIAKPGSETQKSILVRCVQPGILEEYRSGEYHICRNRLDFIMRCFFGSFFDALMDTSPFPINKHRVHMSIIIMNKIESWEGKGESILFSKKDLKEISNWVTDFCLQNPSLVGSRIDVTSIRGPKKKKTEN